MRNQYSAVSAYVTRSKRHRIIRAAIVSQLVTSQGAQEPMTTIAQRVGCSAKLVSRAKKELASLGILGAIPAPAPQITGIPLATFDDFERRLFELSDWLTMLKEDGVEDLRVQEGLAEAHELLRTIRRQGSLPLRFDAVKQRLEDLEALADLLEW